MMQAVLPYGFAAVLLVILAVVIWAIGGDLQYVPMTPDEERGYLREQGMSDPEIDELLTFCRRNGR